MKVVDMEAHQKNTLREGPFTLCNEDINRYVTVINSQLACAAVSPGSEGRFDFRKQSDSHDQGNYYIYYNGMAVTASDHPNPDIRGTLLVGGASPTLFDVRIVAFPPIGGGGPTIALRATNLSATGNWWCAQRPQDGFYGPVRAIADNRHDALTHFIWDTP